MGDGVRTSRWLLALALSLAACGRSGVATCEEPPAADAFELRCESRSTCSPVLSLPVRPPGLLVLVDRSPSMRWKTGGLSKWDEAVGAVDELVERWGADMEWGLALFPDGERYGCLQGDIPVPVGPGQEAAVLEHIHDTVSVPPSEGTTNLAGAIRQAFVDDGLRKPGRLSSVLLITDGAGTCSLDGTVSHEEMVRRMWKEEGIRTFVVGFGEGSKEDTLDVLAEYGGAPADGESSYYEAGLGELAPRLHEIFERHLECVYPLSIPASQLDALEVRIDGTELVPRSPVDGWELEPDGRIRFHGSVCERLRTFQANSVDLHLECRAI